MKGFHEPGMPCPTSLARFAISAAVLLAMPTAIAATGAAAPHGPVSAPPTTAAASADSTTGTSFRYLNIPGVAFHPVSTGTSFNYAGAGCINRTGASTSLFTHKVVLPQGSVVKYLRVYFSDTSASNLTAFFTTYDQLGNFNEHTRVSSGGTGGYGSELSPEITYAVDHFVEPVVVTVNLDSSSDPTLQFCGVRLAYYDIGDDTIFRNGFD